MFSKKSYFYKIGLALLRKVLTGTKTLTGVVRALDGPEVGGVPSLLPPPRPPPRSTCWPVLGSTISMILRSRGLKACCEGADSGLWGCWGGNPCCTWVGCPKKTERDAKKDLNMECCLYSGFVMKKQSTWVGCPKKTDRDAMKDLI